MRCQDHQVSLTYQRIQSFCKKRLRFILLWTYNLYTLCTFGMKSHRQYFNKLVITNKLLAKNRCFYRFVNNKRYEKQTMFYQKKGLTFKRNVSSIVTKTFSYKHANLSNNYPTKGLFEKFLPLWNSFYKKKQKKAGLPIKCSLSDLNR